MRPTFMGLETAKRGIMVNQKALDIIGNNLSNVKTKGYTRQRLDMVTVQNSGSMKPGGSTVSLAGQGVEAVGVRQIRNSFLDSKFREEYGDVGYYDQKAAMLSELQSAISDPEVEGAGIKDALETLLSALTKFSENPYQDTQGNVVLSAFTGVTHILNQYDRKLDQIFKEQKEELSMAVNEVNTTLAKLAELNQTISDQVFANKDYQGGTYGPNELLDQRNLLLDDLSRLGDTRVTYKEDGGVEVTFNGQLAIKKEDGRYTSEQLQVRQDGTTVAWMGSGKPVMLNSGVLKGYSEVLTGNSTSNRGIPYYQQQLDAFAGKFAQVFNHMISNDNGADGYKTLIEGGADGIIDAGNICTSGLWNSNPTYVIQKGNPQGSLDNTYVLNMKSALESKQTFDGGYVGSFSDFITGIVTALGSDIALNESRLDAAVVTAESVDGDRMAISGVSMNEEGIEMMTYNKAYQAMARMMTTMDEQLDVVINKMGIVGR